MDELCPKKTAKRIMSFNVLNVFVAQPQEWHCAPRRAAGAAEVILANDPDFVCLQEYDSFYRWNEENIHSKIAQKYEEVHLVGYLDYNIWNPIFYDREKYTVVESGVVDFFAAGIATVEYFSNHDKTGRSHFREFVWAILEDNNDKTRYLVGNLHFSAGTDEVRAVTHAAESKMVVEKVKELLVKYPDAVTLIGGDYNSTCTGVGGYRCLKEAGFKDTHDIAEQKDNDGSDMHGAGDRDSGGIDHVTTLSELRVEAYYKMRPEKYLHVSDHAPLVVQFSLPKGKEEGK